MAQLVFPSAQVHGELASTGRIDAAVAQRYFAGPHGRGSAAVGYIHRDVG